MAILVPNYRRELQKYSTRKKKCYCLRGGLKLTNSFGPWDHLSMDVPAGKDHISSGNFLLNEMRQSRRCRTTVRGSGRCDEMSLGYLSRLGRAEGHLKFHHFESVEEHIKYYRENKPNSLYLPDNPEPEGFMTKHHNSPIADLPEEAVCACCLQPSVKPLTPKQRQGHQANTIHHCKCLYHCPFPFRTTGKAIIPTCANLIMRLPSLEFSNGSSYWIPMSTTIQKRHTITPTVHDQNQNAASFQNSQAELSSLHLKRTPSGKTRPLNSFPPSKKKTTNKAPTSGPVTQNKMSGQEKTVHEAGMPCVETDSSHILATHHLTGSGRLLSGPLGSSSSIHHPTSSENLQDMMIGVERSPYDKLVSNLATMAHAKKSIQELYTKRTGPEGCKEQVKKLSQDSGMEENGTKPTNFSMELTLDKLDVMQEGSEHKELLGESAILCGPTMELKMEEVNDSSPNKPFEGLFKPSNLAITFTKPRTLFRMKSVQRKMRQHTYSDDKRSQDRSRDSTTALYKRGGWNSEHNAKHRVALNKENNGGEEGVFGTRTHQARCAVRSQERMRLRLKTAAASSNHRESRVRSSVKSSSSSGKKVQVYLIKTTRPLEDILPHLNSTEFIYQQGGTVDLYGE